MIQDSAEQVDSEETKNEEGAIRETSGFDQQEVEDGGEAGAEKVDPRCVLLIPASSTHVFRRAHARCYALGTPATLVAPCRTESTPSSPLAD